MYIYIKGSLHIQHLILIVYGFISLNQSIQSDENSEYRTYKLEKLFESYGNDSTLSVYL